MRVFVLTLALVLSLAAGHADAKPQSFLDNFTNFFRPRPQPARPPPRPVQQRPPQQFQQGPPQQAAQPAPAQPAPAQQQFRRPPQQAPQQQFRQPAPQQQQFIQPAPQPQQQQFRQPAQQPQQQFRPQPQVETFRRPAQQNNNRPAQQIINSAPVIQTTAAPAAPSCNPNNNQGLNGCPGACPNDVDNKGKPVILTYKVNEELCSKFTQSEAERYCQLQGGRPVSLDDNERSQFFINLAIRDRKRYFWTGGKIDHQIGAVTWPSGAREGYVRGERFWSPTGGKKPDPEPQPDNRDGDEVCIAVLNNFYADGVKWHDVGCQHKKPTICEFA